MLVWTPQAEERDQYRKVWVHRDCRQRLLDGERPTGVEVRGPADHELHELVRLCENRLGWLAPEMKRLVPISTSERRRVREREAMLLRDRLDQSAEVVTFEQLQGAVTSLWKRRQAIGRPRGLVAEVNRLRAAGHFRPDPVLDPHDAVPF